MKVNYYLVSKGENEMSIKKESTKKYNGTQSKLMDELYEILCSKYGDNVPDEAVLSLYLARACNILEDNGWKKNVDTIKE